MTLSGKLSELAERHGDRPAVISDERTITYKELDASATRIATGLVEFGIDPGENVGIFLPNIPEYVEVFFGIVRAGGVAVMLNTGLKSEEVRYILDNCRAATFVTTPRFCEVIDPIRSELPHLEHVFAVGDELCGDTHPFEELLSDKQTDFPERQPDDPAGIIYTSGITGLPKGAVLSNRNYLSNTAQIVAATGLCESDRMLAVLPLFHVMGFTLNLLAPLYTGGSVVLQRGFSASDFLPSLARHQITSFTAVPTVYAILNELPDKDKYDLSSLRLCISGAAPLDQKTVQRFEKAYDAAIIEGYGLTEATCAVCINPIDGARKVGSIGVPLSGLDVKLLDEDGLEVEQGQIGEIAVYGKNVMLGYFDDPAATELAIQNDWLLTGDLAFADEDGFLFIAGRKKEMIIRGGENIYPREVEALLSTDPRIQEISVIGTPDEIWGEEVVAHVIVAPGARLTAQDVIDLAKTRLADYKCPRRVVFVEQLPKTVTGKIRKAILFKQYLARTGY
jgi:long-chain acyl-CoA synthetase